MMHMFREKIAESEWEARLRADSRSREHGHATVTNREGLVATYVNGTLWQPAKHNTEES